MARLSLPTAVGATLLVPWLALAACGGDNDEPFDPGEGFNGLVAVIVPAAGSSGDIYVGGRFTSYNRVGVNRIARLNADGTLDEGFDTGTGFDNDVRTIAPAVDVTGAIYAGGLFNNLNGASANHIVRLRANGSRDTGFDIGFGLGGGNVYAIAPATDGSGDVYVGGSFFGYEAIGVNSILRMNTDGSWDDSFSVGSGFNGVVWALAAAANGGVYAGGSFTTYRNESANRIVRAAANGLQDLGFHVGGGFEAGTVYSIAPSRDDDTDIYVGGRFVEYQDFVMDRIIRINGNGSRDTGFLPGIGFDEDAWSVAPARDGSGDIYVGGRFTSYRTAPQNRLVRLNADGSRDDEFDTGTGFNAPVWTVAIAPDGSGDIYVGGEFTSYNGTPVGYIVRLNPDGTID